MASYESIDPKVLFRLVIGGDFAKLKEEGFVARRGLPPIPITFPMSWRSKDSNVEFNLHAWRFLSAAWSYYIKNQSYDAAKEAFDFSISVARDWLLFLEVKKSRYAWYDMSVGIRAMHIAFMKYLCSKYGAEKWEDEYLVDRLAEEHIKWLSNQGNITRGNHAIYQIVGLRVLCELYEDHDLEGYLDNNMERLIDAAFDAHFVSTENSPFYHGYNVSLFKKINPSLFPRLKRKLEDCINEGEKINKWLTAPSGEYYRIGDTEGDGVKLSTQDVEQEGFSNPSDPVYKDLGESGYQVVRSHPFCQDVTSFSLLFRGVSPSKIHAHCDALSFLLYYKGEEVFSDPGKYTYDYGDERDFFTSDVAHSCVGLKGSLFYPHDANVIEGGGLKPIKFGVGGRFEMVGEVRKNLLHHKRTLIFYPGNFLFINDFAKGCFEQVRQYRLVLAKGAAAFLDADANLVYVIKNSVMLVVSLDRSFYNISLNFGRVDSNKKLVGGWVSERYKEKIPTVLLEADFYDREQVDSAIFFFEGKVGSQIYAADIEKFGKKFISPTLKVIKSNHLLSFKSKILSSSHCYIPLFFGKKSSQTSEGGLPLLSEKYAFGFNAEVSGGVVITMVVVFYDRDGERLSVKSFASGEGVIHCVTRQEAFYKPYLRIQGQGEGHVYSISAHPMPSMNSNFFDFIRSPVERDGVLKGKAFLREGALYLRVFQCGVGGVFSSSGDGFIKVDLDEVVNAFPEITSFDIDGESWFKSHDLAKKKYSDLRFLACFSGKVWEVDFIKGYSLHSNYSKSYDAFRSSFTFISGRHKDPETVLGVALNNLYFYADGDASIYVNSAVVAAYKSIELGKASDFGGFLLGSLNIAMARVKEAGLGSSSRKDWVHLRNSVSLAKLHLAIVFGTAEKAFLEDCLRFCKESFEIFRPYYIFNSARICYFLSFISYSSGLMDIYSDSIELMSSWLEKSSEMDRYKYTKEWLKESLETEKLMREFLRELGRSEDMRSLFFKFTPLFSRVANNLDNGVVFIVR